MNTVTGKVTMYNHLGTTVYGNPMCEVYIESPDEEYSGWYRIMNDSMLAYGINNQEYKQFDHKFTLTRAGRLRGSHTRV